MTLLQAEIARRKARGSTRITLHELSERLAALGYRLERGMSARCMARILTGPDAGTTYPCMTYAVSEADTGHSAFHFEARRDENFEQLQRLRRDDSWYVVGKGHIIEL